jgi:hypothetical protein
MSCGSRREEEKGEKCQARKQGHSEFLVTEVVGAGRSGGHWRRGDLPGPTTSTFHCLVTQNFKRIRGESLAQAIGLTNPLPCSKMCIVVMHW